MWLGASRRGYFGFLTMLIARDNPTSTETTRRILGCEPANPGLLEDFETGDYFDTTPHGRDQPALFSPGAGRGQMTHP